MMPPDLLNALNSAAEHALTTLTDLLVLPAVQARG
jgi:hypothetical protein